MILICASCHRRWTLPPGTPRRVTCPGCHRKRLSAGARRGWAARKATRIAAEAAARAPAGTPLPDLAALMADADRAAEKARRAIEAVLARQGQPRRPG